MKYEIILYLNYLSAVFICWLGIFILKLSHDFTFFFRSQILHTNGTSKQEKLLVKLFRLRFSGNLSDIGTAGINLYQIIGSYPLFWSRIDLFLSVPCSLFPNVISKFLFKCELCSLLFRSFKPWWILMVKHKTITYINKM